MSHKDLAMHQKTEAPSPASDGDPINRISSIAEFRANGIAIVDWAKLNGFSPPLVYAVLRGERKCLRGKSYEIAKALGIK